MFSAQVEINRFRAYKQLGSPEKEMISIHWILCVCVYVCV